MCDILLCGYYGFGNAGDEAILGVIAGSIEQSPVKHNISVLTSDVRYTYEHTRLRGVPRMRFIDVAREIRKCDVVVFGGGSLFQDVTSFKSILYYSGICFLACAFRKKYMLAFQGLGPINRKTSKKLLKSVLKNAYYVSLRDEDSAAFARLLQNRNYYTAADPVFLLKNDNESGTDQIKRSKNVAFILKDTGAGDLTIRLAKAANRLKNEQAANIFHISLYPKQDDAAVSIFSCQTGSAGKKYGSVRDLLDIIGQMDLVISARYHGLVFSACAGTQCIPVSYDPKITSLYKELGIKGFETSDDICINEICKLAADLLNNKKTDDDLSVKVDRLRKRAQEGMDDFIKAIGCVDGQEIK